MNVSFTGTQHGMTELQRRNVFNVLVYLGVHQLHHGRCIGSDEQAHQDVRLWTPGVRIVAHPSTLPHKQAQVEADEVRDARPPLERNHDMVDETRTLVAAPRENREALRSGTWATVRYARRIRRPIVICYPDGRIVWENLPAPESQLLNGGAS